VARIEEIRNVYRTLMAKLLGKRPLAKPRRWQMNRTSSWRAAEETETTQENIPDWLELVE
jgi:hypothetical protein